MIFGSWEECWRVSSQKQFFLGGKIVQISFPGSTTMSAQKQGNEWKANSSLTPPSGSCHLPNSVWQVKTPDDIPPKKLLGGDNSFGGGDKKLLNCLFLKSALELAQIKKNFKLTRGRFFSSSHEIPKFFFLVSKCRGKKWAAKARADPYVPPRRWSWNAPAGHRRENMKIKGLRFGK